MHNFNATTPTWHQHCCLELQWGPKSLVEWLFDLNSTQPDFYGDQFNEDLSPGEDTTGMEQRPDPPHPPHLTCSYHPKIDGELHAFKRIPTLMMIIFRENLQREWK
jgi:hypothetical protein